MNGVSLSLSLSPPPPPPPPPLSLSLSSLSRWPSLLRRQRRGRGAGHFSKFKIFKVFQRSFFPVNFFSKTVMSRFRNPLFNLLSRSTIIVTSALDSEMAHPPGAGSWHLSGWLWVPSAPVPQLQNVQNVSFGLHGMYPVASYTSPGTQSATTSQQLVIGTQQVTRTPSLIRQPTDNRPGLVSPGGPQIQDMQPSPQ